MESDTALVGSAIRLFQVQIGVGCPAQLKVVARVQLHLGRVALAGLQLVLIEGAYIQIILALRLAVHIGGDAVRGVVGRCAFIIRCHLNFFGGSTAIIRVFRKGQCGGYLGIALE